MTETYFHVGMVVENLEEAMTRYSEVLGLSFAEPARVQVPRLEDPHPHQHEVHVTFSKDGPPYYELIEAAGDGIFSRRFVGEILYLGLWESDMAGRLAKLEAQGIGIEASFKTSADDVPFTVITKPDLYGIRLEYVDVSSKEGIERWIETGVPPAF